MTLFWHVPRLDREAAKTETKCASSLQNVIILSGLREGQVRLASI